MVGKIRTARQWRLPCARSHLGAVVAALRSARRIDFIRRQENSFHWRRQARGQIPRTRDLPLFVWAARPRRIGERGAARARRADAPSRNDQDQQDERPRDIPAASGAGLMQERTAFRLAMLRNGFQPLLTDCKRPIEKGWPKKIVDEAEILAWDRSALASTGLKIDGDLR